VIQQPTRDLIHQFGLRSVALFTSILLGLSLRPRRALDTNVKVRKLRVAIAIALSFVQALFAIQFLLEIWAATSVDQVRLAVKPLLHVGRALCLFANVRVLLPGTAYREHAARVAGA
jgi:hypothetical protein